MVFSFFGLFLVIGLATLPGSVAADLTEEAGLVETLGAAAFFGAAALALVIALRSRGSQRGFFLMWVFLAALFFGEETSYLQHYIGFSTPEAYAVLNAQNELNIHNLNPLQGGSLIDEPLTLSTLMKSQNLFRLGFGLYFGVLPLLSPIIPRFRVFLQRIQVPIIGKKIMVSSWLVIGSSFLVVLAGAEDSPIAELREMIYASVILFFIIAHARKQES